MSIEENRALVIKFYELMSNLDFDAMFELMADDGTWTVAGNPELFHHAGVGGVILLGKLKALGIPEHRIIIGHSCGSPDKSYHRSIVDGGAYIGFDRFGLEMIQSDDVRVECMHALLEVGFRFASDCLP